jgi:hypothetical protein
MTASEKVLTFLVGNSIPQKKGLTHLAPYKNPFGENVSERNQKESNHPCELEVCEIKERKSKLRCTSAPLSENLIVESCEQVMDTIPLSVTDLKNEKILSKNLRVQSLSFPRTKKKITHHITQCSVVI